MASIKVVPLEMQAIQKLTESLYVINNTNLGRAQAKGVLHILILDSTGQEVQINVPKTWLPVNLGNYCDVPSITKSSKFRELVRKGVIVVISDEQANAILDSEEGKTEAQRVRDVEGRTAAGIRNSFANTNAAVVQHGAAEMAAQGKAPTADMNKEIDINPQVKAIIEGYNGEVPDEKLLEQIKATHGDKDSWIWACAQINDPGSAIYLALADKVEEFHDEEGHNGPASSAPAAPQGEFVINI